MLSRVTTNGQTTIPLPIFQKLGLKEGDWVDFEEQDGLVILTKSEPVFKDAWNAGLAQTLTEWEGEADDDLLAV